MDSLIAAASRALAAGDALGALKRVALRDDPPALALRGIAMAQLGEHARARELLRRAARGFGTHEEMARARCVVAEAEVALAMRDLGGSPRPLAAAAAVLEARGDHANALQARLIAARRLLLLGRLDETEAALAAEIVREYGPFAGSDKVHGVSHDGRHVWAALGASLVAFDPASGATTKTLAHAADAGTAFDGKHLWQIAESRIDKIDPATGKVLASIPAPGGSDSGLAWAEGSLWTGQYRGKQIKQLDPATGAVLRTIESNRFVTGVTWVEGELWHGTWEGDESEIRRIDPNSGAVLDRLAMPPGTGVSGLESDGADLFYAGGGGSGKVRAVRSPKAG